MPYRFTLLFLLSLWGCSTPLPELKEMSGSPSLTLNWVPVDSLNTELPPHIRVFHGHHTTLPLKAWYVEVRATNGRLPLKVLTAEDPEDRRETATQFATRTDACVLLNAGYFTMNKKPADHVGLLMTDGKIHWPATGTMERKKEQYHLSRAAFGITPAGKLELGWAISAENTVYRLDRPLPNFLGHPSPAYQPSASQIWHVSEALGAGPMLVWDGKTIYSAMDELFWETSIPNIHPRSAIGVRRDGSAVLMVVDGRQAASRGVSLTELGDLMRSAGAFRALNLDGGGSSALVVHRQLINRPAGGTFQREVVSAVGAWCR